MLNKQAIGIDLGSSRFIIAVVKQGGVEIVTNEANYRQTPCLVTFDKHRSMGTEAKAQIKKNLQNSIFYPTRYLSDLTQQQLKQESFFNFSKANKNNNFIEFELSKNEEEFQVSSYQAVSSLFTKVKRICELNDINCNDVVISVPSYYNSQERQALLDAAYIANIRPLRILNESTAHITNYSVFRKQDLDNQQPRIVGFIDFGYSKTSFVLAKIFKDNAEIIYQKNDRNLGVRNLDQYTVEHYINFFQMYNNIDLTQNPKSIYRLFDSVEKQRLVFSSNKISPINIECIFENHDLQVNLTLNDYLQIVRDVIVQFQEFCRSIKNQLIFNHFNIKDIHSIEMVGGGMRIPTFQDIVVKAFEIDKISKTLDADESISRGCAIQAAILSPRYSVEKYDIKETTEYDINIKLGYENQGPLKEMKFFPRGTNYNKNLSIQIQKNQPLIVEMVEKLPNKDIALISGYVKPLQQQLNGFKRQMYILLDRNGLVSIKGLEVEHKNKDDQQTKPICEFYQRYEQELDEKTLQQFISKEKEFLENENLQKQLQQVRYDYESYIYRTKDFISQDEYQKFLTPQEKAAVSQTLSQHENWLNNESTDVLDEVIFERYKTLQTSCSCFYDRKNKIDQMQNFLSEMKPNFEQLKQQNDTLLQQIQNQKLQQNQQRIQDCEDIIQEVLNVVESPQLHTIESFDFGEKNEHFQNQIKEVSSTLDQITHEMKDQTKSDNTKDEI